MGCTQGVVMGIQNDFMRRLGLTHPIVQAPMAGGGDTPELVAAAGNAGAIGFIGASYLTPEQIHAAAKEIRARSSRPFGVNLFAPTPPGKSPGNPEAILARVAPYFTELNLPAPALPQPSPIPFEAQLAAALECGASGVSFTFGT